MQATAGRISVSTGPSNTSTNGRPHRDCDAARPMAPPEECLALARAVPPGLRHHDFEPKTPAGHSNVAPDEAGVDDDHSWSSCRPRPNGQGDVEPPQGGTPSNPIERRRVTERRGGRDHEAVER